MISLGPNLNLPNDAVTGTFVLYGGRGSGKTNGATVLAEELSISGHRFTFIDPMGVAWGLKYSADGKGRGIEVLILGGLHGDIPIDPSSGEVVADLISDESISTVIDVCRFKNGKGWEREERIQFVNDFCRRLYMRQVEKAMPIMLIVDEASRFAPEAITSGDKMASKSRAILEQIVEEGRNFGMGVTLISQRSARLAKSVSELAECMVAFRTPGKGSTSPLIDWLGGNIDRNEIRALETEFRKVERGTALVVSPTWLKFEGIAKIRKRTTFDSSATPVAGKTQRVTGSGAQIDLSRYQARMAEVTERVKADDPVELRREIVELRRENIQLLAKSERLERNPSASPNASQIEEIAKAAREQQSRELSPMWQQIYGTLREAARLLPTAEEFDRSISLGVKSVASAAKVASITQHRLSSLAGSMHDTDHEPLYPDPNAPSYSGPVPFGIFEDLRYSEGNASQIGRGGLRRILTALAQRPQGLSARQIGVRAGLSSSSGTFGTYLAKARSEGWIEGSREGMRITKTGIAALGRFDPLPEGPALARYWIGELKGGAGKMLEALYASRKALTANELGAAAGLSPSSGTFATYLSKLRSLELITGDRSALRASEELF